MISYRSSPVAYGSWRTRVMASGAFFVLFFLIAWGFPRDCAGQRYAILAPRTVRPHTAYELAVSNVGGRTERFVCEIVTTNDTIVGASSVEVAPYEVRKVTVPLNSLMQGNYRLKVWEHQKQTLLNTTVLEYIDRSYLVLFQTDKPTYKPGDRVQFRVLFLLPDAKPVLRQSVNPTLYIADPERVRMKQWMSVSLSSGVFEGSFQLAEYTSLGRWTITATVNGQLYKDTFSVEEYTLPLYRVQVESIPKPYFRCDDPNMYLKLRASFVLGGSVQANATVIVRTNYNNYPSQTKEVARKQLTINGTALVDFPTNLVAKNCDAERNVWFDVSVTERSTGVSYNTTSSFTVHNAGGITMEALDGNEAFYPGLAMRLTVKLVTVDQKPLVNQPVTMVYKVLNEDQNDITEVAPYLLTLKTNVNGIVKFAINTTLKTVEVNVEGVYKNQTFPLAFAYPMYEDRSVDYLTIAARKAYYVVHEQITLDVHSNVRVVRIFHIGYCRGSVCESGVQESPTPVNTHRLTFTAMPLMAPQMKLLAFAVKEDGKILSSSIIIRFLSTRKSAILKRPIEIKPKIRIFVQLHMPPSVKRFEDVSVFCLVHNYGKAINVTLEVRPGLKATHLYLAEGATENVRVGIRASSVGVLTVEAILTASKGKVLDSVKQTIPVHPEGLMRTVEDVRVLDFSKQSKLNFNLTLPTIEQDRDVSYGEVTLSVIEHMVRSSHGNGEESLLFLQTTMAVYDYLLRAKLLQQEMKVKLRSYMHVAYQQLNRYRLEDGSFSMFGDLYECGGVWFTASSVQALWKLIMYEAVPVEMDFINDGLDWLVRHSADDGSFNESCSIAHPHIQRTGGKELSLASSVMFAFIGRQRSKEYKNFTNKVVTLLQSSPLEDVYLLAKTTYLLTLIEHPDSSRMLTKLNSLVVTDGKYRYWRVTERERTSSADKCDQEATAYALLANIRRNTLNQMELIQIAQWLQKHAFASESFVASLEKIIVLEALGESVIVLENQSHLELVWNFRLVSVVCFPITARARLPFVNIATGLVYGGGMRFGGEVKRTVPDPKDHKDGHYSIIGSRILRPNSVYRCVVSTFDTKAAIVFRISIVAKEKPIATEEITLNSNESRLISFTVGSISEDEYELVAEGLSGLVFQTKSRLEFDNRFCSVLIQTDKSVYKPGDTIRYRVLVLDRTMKPLSVGESEMMVYIRDGKGNRIKQWNDASLGECGVFQAELTLSSEPVLGEWTINVEVLGLKESKTFDVDEYVLPTYEVTVESPGYTFLDDEQLKVVVNSKYTYGKPVAGELTVSVKLASSMCFRREPSETSICQKVVPIDGRTVVDFNLKEILSSKSYIRELTIDAEVCETLTGRTQKGSTTVRLHDERYQVRMIEEASYFPGFPYNAWIQVTNLDGSPVQEGPREVEISLRNYNTDLYKQSGTLDEKGMAQLNAKLDELDFDYLSVEVKYRGKDYYVQGITKPRPDQEALMRARLLQKDPLPGTDLTFEVACTKPLQFVAYSLLARGELLAGGAVEGADNTTISITIPSTFCMVPRAKLLVHYISNSGFIVSSYTTVEFKRVFENQIQLTLSKDELKPAETLDIDIRTEQDSFVGLLAVDQSVLLLKSGNDIGRDQVVQELEMYESAQNCHGYWDNNTRSMKMEMAVMESDMVAESVNEPTVRSKFPETWIWESISNCKEMESIRKIVPDTITSWIITGFSLSKSHGLGLVDSPSKVNVFMPFFLSIDLPYSVKLGETIRIPVVVFNYMDEDQLADVIFYNNEDEFEFVSETNDQKAKHRQEQLKVPRGGGKTLTFVLKPTKVGHITLKLTAKCALAGDGIERTLLVEPEGLPQYINKALLVDLRSVKEIKQAFEIEIPEDAVPDSTKVEVSVIGDVLGSSIENLDSLIRMPFGCGEQNMLNFVPCIVVLDYLKACKRLTVEIESKAKKCMEVGYQRELTYKHQDGSFSAFGESDKRGSTWLTAFVAKSFQQAAKHLTIEVEVIDKALEWLTKVQTSVGAFPEVGTICHKDMQGGAGSGIALTAYTVIAFLENPKLGEKYKATVDKALAYIKDHISELDDVYAHALAAYALQIANHPLKNEVYASLLSKSNKHADVQWWSKEIPEKNCTDDWWYRPCSVNVEMSAYGLLATLEASSAGLEGLPIMKWLVSQRNDKGGFESTQDTVVGLQALSKMAAQLSSSEADLSLKVTIPNGQEKSLSINGGNILVLQKHELDANTRKVDMMATGKGCALFQLSYKYNVKDVDSSPRFTLKPEAKQGSIKSCIELSVSTSFIPSEDQPVSNMAVMEVDMPSGFVVESETLKQLKQHELVKKVETKRSDTTVVLYFDNIGEEMVNLRMAAFQKHEVENTKPANVIIYDYYDNTRCARSFYEIAV
uniref:TEP1-F n=1 Tax=Anopheles christyi TaxID=43041 RepID=A0A182K440_9DIPT